MRAILLDADAFRCLHGLRLLDATLRALRPDRATFMTEYIARHELNLLDAEVTRLEAVGAVTIVPVMRSSEAGRRYRDLQRRADKREAEAIAWALDEPRASRALFVSRDDGARRLATEERVPNTDVMGLLVEAALTGRLERTTLREALAIWDDRGQQLCRPADYEDFDRTFAKREQQRLTWATSDHNAG
ncbi:MAG: hypothetical protein Q8S73_10215 [Deltaproteobacteria bacterium]|nr:hypothetical protein [Myxococcales bacterium]MDP3214468.1 hypothetical protein [Deltaproteobacteria bacterium]